MQNPAKFREYAEECRRLAEQATGKNKATLNTIADAWINFALEAERAQKIRDKSAEDPDRSDPAGSQSSTDGD
jgi:hypothetical protein